MRRGARTKKSARAPSETSAAWSDSGGCGGGVVFHLERGATAAGSDDVRVVDLEPGALQSFYVVDLGPEDELHRDLVDDDRDAVDFEDVIIVFRLVEGERVLETRTATAANGDAKRLAVVLLAGEKLADLVTAMSLRVIASVGRVSHFTKCSVGGGSPGSAFRRIACDLTAPIPQSSATAPSTSRPS